MLAVAARAVADASTSSVALRILIADRSSGEALVLDFPVIWSRALDRPQVAVDRGAAHRQQFGTDVGL